MGIQAAFAARAARRQLNALKGSSSINVMSNVARQGFADRYIDRYMLHTPNTNLESCLCLTQHGNLGLHHLGHLMVGAHGLSPVTQASHCARRLAGGIVVEVGGSEVGRQQLHSLQHRER